MFEKLIEIMTLPFRVMAGLKDTFDAWLYYVMLFVVCGFWLTTVGVVCLLFVLPALIIDQVRDEKE